MGRPLRPPPPDVLVDPEDRHLIEVRNVSICRRPKVSYAIINFKEDGKWKNKYLHRVIMNAAPGQIVDHVNGNGLDNRRVNLRFSTYRQNAWNTRARRDAGELDNHGVRWSEEHGAWHARISFNAQEILLGYFKSKDDAVQCSYFRDEAAPTYHGTLRARSRHSQAD